MTVLERAFTTALHVRDGGDGRVLFGALLPWGTEAQVMDPPSAAAWSSNHSSVARSPAPTRPPCRSWPAIRETARRSLSA
jgi:hypothetical protein